MTPAWLHVALPALAFVAGFVNSIGGGGGLITLPALLGSGLPPHLALGTNKGQAVFGAFASVTSFWRKREIDRGQALLAFTSGFTGSIGGALLQLAIRPEPLRPLILILLVLALVVVLSPMTLVPQAGSRHKTAAGHAAFACALGCYDGFFGPGTGTLLLVGYVRLFGDPFVRASGNAKVVNFASNLAAMLLFASRQTVIWSIALPMAAANLLGSYVGAHTAIRRGAGFVRWIVVLIAGASLIRVAVDVFVR
jgi:uncharacterized membrane protein YfcA